LNGGGEGFQRNRQRLVHGISPLRDTGDRFRHAISQYCIYRRFLGRRLTGRKDPVRALIDLRCDRCIRSSLIIPAKARIYGDKRDLRPLNPGFRRDDGRKKSYRSESVLAGRSKPPPMAAPSWRMLMLLRGNSSRCDEGEQAGDPGIESQMRDPEHRTQRRHDIAEIVFADLCQHLNHVTAALGAPLRSAAGRHRTASRRCSLPC
jgi:hypothetical protein